MTAVVRNFHLLGSLGKKHGERFELASYTAAQGVLSLCQAMPDLEDDLMSYRDVKILVRRGNQADPMQEAFLRSDLGDATDIYLVPSAEGAGIETALIVAYGAFWGTVAYVAIQVAVSIVIGAIISALSPKPKSAKDEARTKPSRIFSGPLLMTDAGDPIPKGYGMSLGNGYLISQGIGSKDIDLYE